MIIQRLYKTSLFACLLLSGSVAYSADDNIIAHELFSQGNYAQAAEIFTDPAWKGVALYRSEQWWRAAEAFVRADDALSQYNLGNSYVQLSYYELALDAYLRALSINPDFSDAEHNANIMRQLIAAKNNEQSGQQALQSQQNEIDRVESESEEQPGNAGDGEEQNKQGDNKTGSEEASTKVEKKSADAQDDSEGGNKSEQTMEEQTGDPGAGNVQGARDNSEAEERPSGGSEADVAENDSQSSGRRTELEQKQATEQWLNQINHAPYRFLQSRIELESARRQKAGQAAPAGGSAW